MNRRNKGEGRAQLQRQQCSPAPAATGLASKAQSPQAHPALLTLASTHISLEPLLLFRSSQRCQESAAFSRRPTPISSISHRTLFSRSVASSLCFPDPAPAPPSIAPRPDPPVHTGARAPNRGDRVPPRCCLPPAVAPTSSAAGPPDLLPLTSFSPSSLCLIFIPYSQTPSLFCSGQGTKGGAIA